MRDYRIYIQADSEEQARLQLSADYRLLLDRPIAKFRANQTACEVKGGVFKAYLFYCECLRLQQPLNLQSFKQAFPDALRDSGQTEKLIEIGVKNGYTLLNIHWKDRITTVQRWENG